MVVRWVCSEFGVWFGERAECAGEEDGDLGLGEEKAAHGWSFEESLMAMSLLCEELRV